MNRTLTALCAAAAIVFAPLAVTAQPAPRAALGGPELLPPAAVPDNGPAAAVPNKAGDVCLPSKTVRCQTPVFDHIVVVVMENKNYSQIIGNKKDAPFINQLADGGALLTNYRALSHPSLPNYLALYAGNTFGIKDNKSNKVHKLTGPTLATILQGAGRTFTGYVERPKEKMAHNPWEYFPEGLSVTKDFKEFPTADFASLPNVAFVSPDLNHDMHDASVAYGDRWLRATFSNYIEWARTNNSLFAVVWDENEGQKNNIVPLILAGARVRTGRNDEQSNHYNFLSTILAYNGLTGPAFAANAAPIDVLNGAEIAAAAQ